MDSLEALDTFTATEGNNILHVAIDVGNKPIFDYLILILKARDLLPQHNNHQYETKSVLHFKSFQEVLEYHNKQHNTPLLYSAKRDQYQFFVALVEEGANLVTHCAKLMNPLHYAVINCNQLMIQFIVYADAEGDRLMSQRNYRNETPVDLDDKHRFQSIFHHIWQAASSLNHEVRLEYLIRTKQYNINEKTLVGQNTPLHFAIIKENSKAIKYLLQQPDILFYERNSLG